MNVYTTTVAQIATLWLRLSKTLTPVRAPFELLFILNSPSPSMSAWPTPPCIYVQLTTLREEQGQLTFFIWGSGDGGSVCSSRFSKHLSVYFGPTAFTEAIKTQSEVDPTHPVAQKGPMTSFGSTQCY